MVPVGPRRPGLNREDVVDLLPRGDRVERAAVGPERQVDAVPVDRGRFGQLVAEMHDHAVTFPRLERGTRNLAVEGESAGLEARGQLEPGLHGRERHFHDARLAGGVGQHGRRRERVAPYGGMGRLLRLVRARLGRDGDDQGEHGQHNRR